jgi:hypothetical protein
MTRTLLYCICIVVTACASLKPQRVGVPASYSGETVRVKSMGKPSPIGVLQGEAFGGIKSIDGSAPGSEYTILPGKHSFEFYWTNMGYDAVGKLDFVIDRPGTYEVTAKRQGTRFEIVFTRVPDGSVVANGVIDATSHTPLYIPLIIK